MVNKLRTLLLIALCLPLVCAWPNTGKQYKPAAAAYSGPGDIVSGAAFWGSCQRSYSAAYASGSNAACNITRASDSHTCDLLIATSGTVGNTANCSNGADNGQSASSFCTSTTCSVNTVYDQSQSAQCSTSCNVVQATAADQPPLILPGAGHCTNSSVNCLNPNASNSYVLATAGNYAGASQPFSIDAVLFNTLASSANAGQNAYTISNNGGNETVYVNGTNAAAMYDGSFGSYTATESSWLAMADVFNGASSVANVNGTETTVSPGTGAFGAVRIVLLSWTATPTSNTSMTGYVEEAGLWPSGFSGANRTAVCKNQQSYYGAGNFGASC